MWDECEGDDGEEREVLERVRSHGWNTQAMLGEHDIQGMYFLHNDVKDRTRHDPMRMRDGIKTGRVYAAEGAGG